MESHLADKEQKKKDPREYLILGCGHHSCDFRHPKQFFITADMNEKAKPDYKVDFTNKLEVSQMVTTISENNDSLAGIVYERLPLDLLFPRNPFSTDQEFSLESSMMRLLKERGYLIYITNLRVLCENIDRMHGEQLQILLTNAGDSLFIRQKTKMNSEFVLDDTLQSYLTSYLKEEPRINTVVTVNDEFKARAKILLSIVKQRDLALPDDFIYPALLEEQKPTEEKGITAGALKDICDKYKPGMARKLFTGKTEGMLALINYLKTFQNDHVLNEKECFDILDIIKERVIRTARFGLNYDPTRSTTGGATGEIHKEISLLILNHLLASKLPKPKPSTSPRLE
jgi:hypothetical protein